MSFVRENKVSVIQVGWFFILCKCQVGRLRIRCMNFLVYGTQGKVLISVSGEYNGLLRNVLVSIAQFMRRKYSS